MLSSDPCTALASFATEYSGNACDIENDWAIVGNKSGFNDDGYNEIIDRAFAEKDPDKRAVILHEAENYLLTQMPIIPIAFNQYFYMGGEGISGEAYTFNGYVDLRRVTLKNYLDFYPVED